jgi:outer membrane biosynthesis protein TonB
MSNNYSRISIKVGTIEITIEGNNEFVSEQYRQIFNLPKKQNTTTVIPEKPAEEKSSEPADSSKSPPQAAEKKEKEKQTQKPKTKKSVNKSAKPKRSKKPAPQSNKALNTLGSDFKKWLAKLPDSVETRDKILAAAYFNQTTNSDNKFYMRGIRAILKEHNITVSNISNFLDTFEIQKIIAKVSDSSRKGYQFTKEGEEYIVNLLGV